MWGEGNENHILKTQGEMNVLSTNRRVQTHCAQFMFEVLISPFSTAAGHL